MNGKIIRGIRIRVKDCWLTAKVKISSDLVINTNQYDLLSRKYNYGFLKLNNTKRNKLEFTGPKGISLYDRLKNPICEYDFFFVLEQFIDVTQKLEKIGLSRSNLVLDMKYIFFNESTKELYFIYLPVATPHGGEDILTFIEQIIYSVKPEEADPKYLSDFNYFIKKLNEFDAGKIESYICEVDRNIVKTIKKVDLENPIDNIVDDEQTDLMEDDEKIYLMDEDDEKTDLFIDDESTCLLDDEATELFSEDDEKGLFNEKWMGMPKYPILIRTLTEEIIRINKPVFRIGKEENCVDYIVTNNIAISRSHADIISRGDRYFVFDLRSKNKSYINNRVLPAEQEVEIFNGDVLKLANEEFLFQV